MITFTLPDDDAAMVLKMLLALTMIAEREGAHDITYPLSLLEELTRQTEMQIAAVNDNVSIH